MVCMTKVISLKFYREENLEKYAKFVNKEHDDVLYLINSFWC